MAGGFRKDVGRGKIWKDVIRWRRGHKNDTKLPENFGQDLA